MVEEFFVRERLFDNIVSFTIRTFILKRSANNNVGIKISSNSLETNVEFFFRVSLTLVDDLDCNNNLHYYSGQFNF